MTSLGQLCLLASLVASGYAAFACILGGRSQHRLIAQSGVWAAAVSVAAISVVACILAWALLVKNFSFQYVAQYTDASLPWHYALSAFWVGQAGSLLLWAWFVAALAIVYRFAIKREPNGLGDFALGILMAYLCFLLAIMAFAADPMQPTLAARNTGDGLSPQLQHPAMLIHPPIVFLGYAAWGIPFALALAALICGKLDDQWVRQSRPWAIFAWIVLGAGILWGAEWAYEELGWGGYWGWDPVENGSLLPWLTGTAFLHGLMTWRYPGVFKKSTLFLALVTFALCNFATFLTRSGIFSSLHAFSQSPIGWMFLVWLAIVMAGGVWLIVVRRGQLDPERPITSVFSREAAILIGTLALLLLSTATLLGTLAVPLSGLVSASKIVVGTAFYNSVLIPVGLILLAGITATPLLRWRAAPTAIQLRMLALAATAGGIAVAVAVVLGVRHWLGLAVTGLTVAAVVATAEVLAVDARSWLPDQPWHRPIWALLLNRRRYAGFLLHLSFVCLAIGVAGSALGTRQTEVDLAPGESTEFAGRSVCYSGLIQRNVNDVLIVEAKLEISEGNTAPYVLLPAQHLHHGQDKWITRVAIHSSWGSDFYTILYGSRGQDRVDLTLVENPMMRWLWASGYLGALAATIALWPARRRPRRQEIAAQRAPAAIPRPHVSTDTPLRSRLHGR